MFQRELDVWLDRDATARPCPRPNCKGVAIVEETDPRCRCQLCGMEWCGRCKEQHDAQVTCENHAEWRKQNGEVDERFEALVREKHFKACPNCQNMVEKTEGCNHMRCRCEHHFCYVCGQSCPQAKPYDHFDRPGACELFEGQGSDDFPPGMPFPMPFPFMPPNARWRMPDAADWMQRAQELQRAQQRLRAKVPPPTPAVPRDGTAQDIADRVQGGVDQALFGVAPQPKRRQEAQNMKGGRKGAAKGKGKGWADDDASLGAGGRLLGPSVPEQADSSSDSEKGFGKGKGHRVLGGGAQGSHGEKGEKGSGKGKGWPEPAEEWGWTHGPRQWESWEGNGWSSTSNSWN